MSDIEPHALFSCDENGAADKQIAYVTPATIDDAYDLLSMPPNGDDTRSDPFWMRLVDGTLLLGVFPQGDTYEKYSHSGVCDFEHVQP
jgi:hypothetical protein